MRYFEVTHFSTSQSQICKGLAILFIVIHNVVSKLDGEIFYNEFNFKTDRFWDLLSVVYLAPTEIINVFMTFFGHYGVQVFIFLSAYGLMRSISTQPNTWVEFVIKRIKQLLLPMTLVMILFLALDYYYNGIFSARTGDYNSLDVLYRMLFISNFFPEKSFLVIGPWWFLSLIMQFYCIFLPLHALQLRWGNASLAIVSLLSIIVAINIDPWLTKHNFPLYATILGHLPEFALGMYVASLDKIKVPLWLIVAACAGLVLGNMYKLFWYFAPVCSIVVIMSSVALLFKYSSENSHFSRALEYVGLLSLYIFLLNGVIREPILPLAKASNDPFLILMYAGIVTLICLITAQLFLWLEIGLKKFYVKVMSK